MKSKTNFLQEENKRTIDALKSDNMHLQQELQQSSLQIGDFIKKETVNREKEKNQPPPQQNKPKQNKMNDMERRKFINKTFTAQEEDATQSMIRKLKKNPPPLVRRLIEKDKNQDGLVTTYEFNQALEKLNLEPKEIMAIDDAFGFNERIEEMYIDDINKIMIKKSKDQEDKEMGI